VSVVKIAPKLVLGCVLIAMILSLAGCAGTGGGGSGKRAEVVSAALSQIGTPYRYGGDRPGQGLDCSGLTQYAYGSAGVPIPRMCLDQLRAARPVGPGALRPGDLVFFQTGPGVHHVGLMVDADRFVHASTSKRRVQVTRLSAPYWSARYLGAGAYLD
jgi:cell wall-associated NlpC family hydrolase